MSKKKLTREEIDKEYKWDVESFYKDIDEWEKDYKEIDKDLEKLLESKGKLGNSGENLLEALKSHDNVYRRVRNLYTYASLRMDEDTRNSKYQALSDKAFRLITRCSEAASFFTPELLSLEESLIKKFIDENDELKIYEQYLNEIIRKKDHILSEKEEALLAQVGEVTSVPEDVFGMLNNADLKFPSVKDEYGNQVEITHGSYIPLLESEDREVRKNAFQSLYGVYKGLENTFTSILTGKIKSNILNANVRGYKNTMEASLDQNNISTEVYDNLLDSIDDNLEPMYKYLDIRKRALDLDQVHMYDIYTPIVKDMDTKYEFDEAVKLIQKGLAPLGEEYMKILNEGFESRWIDVYETEGKRSGGYSSGSYDSKPFILLNYTGNLDSVFTTAHEMGHSVHSYLSRENQPFVYSDYGIFVAEVASTVNEVLLINYMLKNAKSKEEEIYLLNHYLDSFRGTVYRQSMFAEFEKIINEYVESGDSLTADYLNETYGKLNEKYFGEDVVIDEEIKSEWSRIPHFYYNYYVYQYATGFSAAVSIAEKILNGEEGIIKKYMNFLKSGSSDYPLNILKEVGIDMTKRDPIDEALKVFAEVVDDLDKLI